MEASQVLKRAAWEQQQLDDDADVETMGGKAESKPDSEDELHGKAARHSGRPVWR